MCIVNCRRSDSPEPEPAPRPVTVPGLVPLSSTSRPISLQAISPHHSRRSIQEIQSSSDRRRSRSSIRVPLPSQSQHTRPEPPARRSSQIIVIEKPKTPRTSGTISEGMYSYGTGPVPVRMRPPSPAQNEARRSRASQASEGRRRRDSSTYYGKDPRASNASWRSTRERIVVVDDMGTRREYYR